MKKFLILICIFLARPVIAELPSVLTDADIETYTQIFALQADEKINSAIKLDKKIENPILMNEVLYQRYTSKTYKTRGAELSAWQNKYSNMPGADRIEKIAKIKKTTVKKPNPPKLASWNTGETAQSENWTAKKYSGKVAKKIDTLRIAIRRGNSKNARNILEEKSFKSAISDADYGRLAGRLAYLYYTNGEIELAKKFGFISSDALSEYGLWTMGLIYFKEEKFKDSAKYFSRILDLKQINNARKTEAAFWAGRASELNEDNSSAEKYWKIAAELPMSFYGALAMDALGNTPKFEFYDVRFNKSDTEELLDSKYGQRAFALLQIGQTARAELYLRNMITPNASDSVLHSINTVASEFGMPRAAMAAAGVMRDRGISEIDDNVIYSAQYPLPDWEPLGGWSIDRALLFAITKQESGFKTSAQSSAGANGVMQIMPTTAKLVARKNNIDIKNLDMTNPEHNLFLGQQHIVDLFAMPIIDNNIIKMLAAYNAGPGFVSKYEKSFGTNDPLLYIESFPAYETRGYIKRVISNLWLYRAKLKQPLDTLHDLSNGVWPKYSAQDNYVMRRI